MTKFNKSQQEIIDHTLGPMLVVAGAGTGKTTVVTHRIKKLIDAKLARANEILAITFTDKAAFEMQDRMDKIMSLGYSGINIFTFHGFCEQFLRQHAIDIGLSNGFKLLTEIDAIKLFKKHLFFFELDYYRPLGNPNKNIQDILTHFSRLQDEYVSENQYLAWAQKQEDKKYLELAKVYAQWQDLKIQKGVMGFGDLIYYSVKALEKINVNDYKFIMVDEFQDTNYSQNYLIELLSNKHKNLIVVCDDDQSIYNWRGSSVANVMQFKKKYPQAQTVVLNHNYRSSQIILDRAYALITKNNPDRLEVQEKISKKLISSSPDGPDIINFWGNNSNTEAEWVAITISNIKDQMSNLGEVAILVRANAHAEVFLKALHRHNIPAQFLGPQKLFFQPEIQELLAWLRILVDPTDAQSWYKVLSMPIWQLDTKTILNILTKARRENIMITEAMNDSDLLINTIYQSQVTALKSQTGGQIIFDLLNQSKMLSNIYSNADQSSAHITKFMTKIMEFEQASENRSALDLLDWIDLSMEVGESPSVDIDDDWTSNNCVNVMTYHGAKGLEFETVFMVNLVNDRFPSRNRKDGVPISEDLIRESAPIGDAHVLEERRLFYVGMTRAKKNLFFTGASFYPDNKREKKWSAFVQEVFDSKDIKTESFKAQKEIYEQTKNELPEKVDFSITKISHSQIETFQTCPVHYKAKYILKLPSGPKAASTFGNTLHLVMQQLVKDDKQDIKDLLDSNWSPLGFESPEHNQEAKKKAIEYLEKYKLNSDLPKAKILFSEQAFCFSISSNLMIEGKIDRVDDMGNGKIRIVDYKTSPKLLEQKGIDKDLQLSIYAMAASKLWGYKPEDISLCLYYFAEDKLMQTSRTLDQLRLAEKEIIAVRNEILTSNFTCTNPHICKKCDYQFLCSTTSPVE